MLPQDNARRDREMSLAFRCEANGVALCMNGASCASLGNGTDVRQSCSCVEGYVHDFSYGHFENCSMPGHALVSILVSYSIAGLGCFLLLFRLQQRVKQANVKVVARLHIVNLILEWFHVLAVYLQNGVFEAGAFFACLNCIGLTFVSLGSAAIILGPLYLTDLTKIQSMRKTFQGYGIISAGVWVVGYAGIAASCRIPDKTIFHGFVVYLLTLCIVQIASLTLLVCRTTMELYRQVSSVSVSSSGSRNQAAVNRFSTRLRRLSIGLIALGAIEVTPLLPLPAVLLVFGSIPYLWIFWALMICLNCFISVLILGFFSNHYPALTRRCLCAITRLEKGAIEPAVDNTDEKLEGK